MKPNLKILKTIKTSKLQIWLKITETKFRQMKTAQ
jgi:hypothetical protein